MSRYNLDTPYHPKRRHDPLPDPATMDKLWKLFIAIGEFWENNDRPEAMKSNFETFVANRISLDARYLHEYANATAVLDELIDELGEADGYKKLFTDPQATISPPTTDLARARQLVSNEFVALQLALGGFKAFGGATNYLGYIGGPNIEGRPPYRTYDGREP